MRVIWKFVITFEKMNTMETILFHVSKVFYKGMLKKKKVTLREPLCWKFSRVTL